MRNYTITVNGTIFDVTVEEAGADSVQRVPAPAPAVSVPVSLPQAAPVRAAAPAPAPAVPAARPAAQETRAASPAAAAPAAPETKKAPAGSSGSIKVEAGAAGKVFQIEASVGQKVSRGDTVVIIEAMKMEIPVVAPEDGTVASIDVAVGDAIQAGQSLATLN